MDDRLLVCVDGSAAALAAARLGIDMVARHRGMLRAICVIDSEAPASDLGRLASSAAERPRGDVDREAHAVLAHVVSMGRAKGVTVETVLAEGDPARRVLEEADAWAADLILVGRVGRHGPGSRVLGGHTARILEFSERPVVVVPIADLRPS